MIFGSCPKSEHNNKLANKLRCKQFFSWVDWVYCILCFAEFPSEQGRYVSFQNLANLVEFGAKEFYMECVNPFIVENKQKIVDFIEELGDRSITVRVPKSSPHQGLKNCLVLARAVISRSNFWIKDGDLVDTSAWVC